MLNYLKINSYLVTVLSLVCVGWLSHAQAQEYEENTHSKLSYTVAVDAWRLDPSVKQDPAPWNAQNTNLLLPNAANTWHYRSTSPFVSAAGSTQILKNTTLSFQLKAEQNQGLRLDEALVEHHLSPSFGVRAGVVNYKTSWCRTYEPDNGWIREIETLCIVRSFRDVMGGAPGVQLFTNTAWQDYRIQTQVGLYRPLAFNYAPYEFGNIRPSAVYTVTKNNKVGFNINVLNLQTGVEGRLSYLRADQKAYSPQQNLLGDWPQKSDMWYWGLSFPITPKLSGRVTQLLQLQNIACWSSLPIVGACNLTINERKSATAFELAYRITAIDLLSVGVSQTKFDMALDLYDLNKNSVDLTQSQLIDTRQLGIAWRHDWGNRMFGIVQLLLAQQKNAFLQEPLTSSHGNALGVRFGYQF